MKRILIISPHFPPSNLAGVHRSRLFAMHLPEFGWEPVVLTVHEKYYEEALDWDLVRLLPEGLRIEKVSALPTRPLRLVGDIGIRGFVPMLLRTLRLIRKENIDFVYIPIPSNYAALIGRIANWLTGVKYGIDYIDPWVHRFPGSEQTFSKHWWAMKLAEILEPIALKKADLITGVAEGYYEGALRRNPHLRHRVVTAAMPYGGEKQDHENLSLISRKPYLFSPKAHRFQFVYAGAMLPKAYAPLEKILESLREREDIRTRIALHFIGTGKHPNDPEGYNIRPLAERYGLWQTTVFEYPARIPYLDVLVHLQAADGIFILGSTEPHYTPSKVYQAILSKKPILAVLHRASTAVQVIRESGAGVVLDFDGEAGLVEIGQRFADCCADFLAFARQFDPDRVHQGVFERYSAREVTRQLAQALDRVMNGGG